MCNAFLADNNFLVEKSYKVSFWVCIQVSSVVFRHIQEASSMQCYSSCLTWPTDCCQHSPYLILNKFISQEWLEMGLLSERNRTVFFLRKCRQKAVKTVGLVIEASLEKGERRKGTVSHSIFSFYNFLMIAGPLASMAPCRALCQDCLWDVVGSEYLGSMSF